MTEVGFGIPVGPEGQNCTATQLGLLKGWRLADRKINFYLCDFATVDREPEHRGWPLSVLGFRSVILTTSANGYDFVRLGEIGAL